MSLSTHPILQCVYISDDRVEPAGSCRLWTDNFCDLQLSLCIRGTYNRLELALLGWLPRVVPDHPGVGRHRWFDLALVPRTACVETQLDFADTVWTTKCDAAELLFGPAQCLVMARGIDARKNLDRSVVCPALALPIAEIVARIDFNLVNPFHILDAVESRHDGSEGEAMFLGKLLAIHQEGEKHILLHGPFEGNTVVVAVDAPEHDVTRDLFVRTGLL